nr:carbonic anhydrase14 carbonic anhydrase 14-like Biomineralization/Shell formation [Biomphalaria glabrata]
MANLLLALAVCFLVNTNEAADWSYSGDNGPEFWQVNYKTCGQQSQSPINIYEGDVTVNTKLPPFVYRNYDVDTDMSLTNNGHSAMVVLGESSQLLISGGGLVGQYKAIQFHFHWGEMSNTGSEHLLSGHAFPMELHIVHYNTKYMNVSEALKYSDGLAVLGFMYLTTDTNNSNNNYADIVGNLQNIQVKGATVQLNRSKVASLLPASYLDFYRYAGSLTTPTCDQSVIWTVFVDPIYISENQLNEFRKLLDAHNHTMSKNFRPVQPLNRRTVVSNYKPHIHWQYGHDEPNHWKDIFESCGGQNQSPINIDYNITIGQSTLPLLAYQNYEKPPLSGMILKNNGHTVELELLGDEIAIFAGGLAEPYIAKQFHFHWGSNSSRGSEHQLDSKSYPMELHIVHYRKSLKNLTTAATQYRGVAVLGFFCELSPLDNLGLKSLTDHLRNVATPDTNVSIPAFSLNSFLPAFRSDFYRYDGSLTTPSCAESVIWTVFKDTVKISAKQLEAFRQVQSYENDKQMPMVDNYRPVQPLYTRAVHRNFKIPPPKTHWSYEGSHGASHWSSTYQFCASSATSRQSPIDIVSSHMQNIRLPPFILEGYDSSNSITLDLKNNGHTVQADISGGNLFISGAGLPGTYRAAQFHFHWGSDNKRGSEHLIEGRPYPLEIHIVHYNIDQPDIIKAVTEKNGLAVLGILFEISEADNKGYEKIIDELNNVFAPYSRYQMNYQELRQLLPKNVNEFYRYEGSLTTPECHETVTWTIFKETMKISTRQLMKFRRVYTEREDLLQVPLVDNFRPVQPLNKRTIISNFPYSSISSGSRLTLTVSMFVIASVCVILH